MADGRVIIDSSVMGTLLSPDQAKSQFLRSLSPKATEVLKLMSKGYRNEAIAEVLSRDLKTIERHINNIYSAFENGDLEGMHPRVRATLMYLKATGEVPAEPI